MVLLSPVERVWEREKSRERKERQIEGGKQTKRNRGSQKEVMERGEGGQREARTGWRWRSREAETDRGK